MKLWRKSEPEAAGALGTQTWEEAVSRYSRNIQPSLSVGASQSRPSA